MCCLAVVGCGSDGSNSDKAEDTGRRYSASFRRTMIDACVTNAQSSSQGRVTEEQAGRACECAISKMEQRYTEAEMRDLEQRLVDGKASDAEAGAMSNAGISCIRAEVGV